MSAYEAGEEPGERPGAVADRIPDPEREADESAIAAIGRISAVPTILKVVSEITGLRLALVARVSQQTWTACAVLDRMNFGLSVGDHLAVATTLCSEVRDSHAPVVIDHASADEAYCTHPTPKMYGFESYIAVPIFRPNGEYFGNVCALDPAPSVLRGEKTIGMMMLFAELIGLQLVAEEHAEHDRDALLEERRTAELREQFLAVVGHDLRNPLFAILAGSQFLLGLQLETTHRTVLQRIRSSAERMAHLVDEVMDFARGRLGGGFALPREQVDMRQLTSELVAEITSVHPERTLQLEATDAGTAWIDRSRVAQMLSNLLSNAVQHSTPGTPIEVRLRGAPDQLMIAVTSHGEPIPPKVLQRLFTPYYRVADGKSHTGLGLGLHIANDIARAHGGSIAAQSDGGGATTFSIRLPRGASGDG